MPGRTCIRRSSRHSSRGMACGEARAEQCPRVGTSAGDQWDGYRFAQRIARTIRLRPCTSGFAHQGPQDWRACLDHELYAMVRVTSASTKCGHRKIFDKTLFLFMNISHHDRGFGPPKPALDAKCSRDLAKIPERSLGVIGKAPAKCRVLSVADLYRGTPIDPRSQNLCSI